LLVCTFALLPEAKSDPVSTSLAWKSLPYVQNAIGITNYAWDGDSLCFSNEQHLIRFYQGRRKSDVNGTTVWLNASPDGSVTSGDWRIASTDLDLLLLSLLPTEEGAPKPLRVLLDPGHGGEDDGASSKNPAVKEKDLNLALALKLGARLTGAGLHVSYTRTNDTTLALDERSRLARKIAADLFVSVHANYASNAGAAGVETYVLPPSGYPGTADGSRVRGWQIGNRNDYHNTLLGFSIHRNLAVLGQVPDRGLKRQSFFVLRETSCPAVLLEFGFLSNPAETQKMLDAAWQEKCAAAITDGILSYSKKVEALDRAVAEKRAHDADTNERWRLHLTAQAAKKAAAQPVRQAEAARPSPTTTVHSASAALSSSSGTTNTLPLELNTLIEYYATGEAE
jgi:N-acetylmuramoyl-L-alanine amidase